MSEKIIGLLGRKLSHSWSPLIHRELDCPNYQLIELEPEELEGFLRREDIGGLNVTIPYKRAVMPFCDVIDEAAQAIGSVNTIVRREDGKLYAYNTDAAGFVWMAERAGISFRDRKVLILGSGGASLTAQAITRRHGAREVVVISRTGENDYHNLYFHADADIIVNATPVGMYPETGKAPLDLSYFPKCQGVLDMVYNPHRTALMIQAEELGIPCTGGLSMLVAQAKVAAEYFQNRTIPDSENERILNLLEWQCTNIVIIGMPGAGKTTIGKALEKLTGRQAIDVDEWLIAQIHRTIPDIFAKDGEATFRAMERGSTAAVGRLSGKIVITGGGVVKDSRNYNSLHQNGRIYQILRDLDALPTEGRPLSQSTKLSAMWEERRPMYEAFRDVAIENDRTIQDAAERIWADFCASFQRDPGYT